MSNAAISLSPDVDNRLVEWAHWLLKSIENGLNYPPQSIFVTALQGSKSTRPISMPDNPRAEEIDFIVNQLKKIHPTWAKILKAEYTRDRNITALECAKKLGISKNMYYQYLLLAKTFIESRII